MEKTELNEKLSKASDTHAVAFASMMKDLFASAKDAGLDAEQTIRLLELTCDEIIQHGGIKGLDADASFKKFVERGLI